MYLVKKAALEGAVEVFREVGGDYQDAVETLHLLQDDILEGVLHLIDGIICPLLADADDGVSLVEKENGSNFKLRHQRTVTVEESLNVLLALPYPLTLDLWHIHHHHLAPREAGKLIHHLSLPRSGPSVKEAGERLPKAFCFMRS